MPDKRLANLSNECLDSKEVLNIENIGVETLEDYKALNEKCDKIIVKIKSRKASNTRKK